MSNQLVDSERETVVQLGLLKSDGVRRDEGVLDHEPLGLVFDDEVVLVDRARGES